MSSRANPFLAQRWADSWDTRDAPRMTAAMVSEATHALIAAPAWRRSVLAARGGPPCNRAS